MAVGVGHALPFAAAQFARPTFHLGMTVQKREAASAIVIGGGEIAPAVQSAVAAQGGNPIGVIDGVRMLVQEDQQLGRASPGGIGRLFPTLPLIESGSVGIGAREGIHRHAADAGGPAFGSLASAKVMIGRALKYVLRL